MLKRRFRLLLVVASALFVAPALLLPDTGIARSKRVPFAQPDQLGPFAVGRSTFMVVDPDRDDRALTVDAWYPVDEEDAGGPPSVYDLVFTGLPSEVAFEAPLVSTHSRFPLVVFSHGNNGIRFQSFFLMEALASHGFLVVAPDHAGNTALDLFFGGPPFAPRDRPLDVSLLITRMLEKNDDPGDPFYDRIDPWRIGVSGHSFGGFTTLWIAAGLEDVPPDPRVSAIMPISSASGGLSDEELQRITIPALLLSGTSDATVVVEPGTTRAFEQIAARPRYRVDIVKAGHNSFTDICDLGAALAAVGLPADILDFLLGSAEEGCGPALIPIEEAHRISSLYGVSFFKSTIAQDKRYKRFLTSRAARGLEVEFAVVKDNKNKKSGKKN